MQTTTASQVLEQQRKQGIRMERRVCPIHGFYTAFIRKNPDLSDYASPCPACKEEQAEILGLVKVDASHIIGDRLVEANVPQDLSLVTFETMPDGLRKNTTLVDACLSLVSGDINNLVILGGNGVGKTTLAVATLARIAQECLQGNRQVSMYYTTEAQLLRSLKTTFSRKDGPTEQDIINRMSRVDVLVIEEIGKAKDSDYNLLAIEEIIDARHRSKRTIVCGNPIKSDFESHLSESSRSKLREKGLSFEIKDKDHRRD